MRRGPASARAGAPPVADFVFLRGADGLHARRGRCRITVPAGPDLLDRAAEAVERARGAFVCGALPFDGRSGAELLVPEDVARCAGLARAGRPAAGDLDVLAEPDPGTYREMVREAGRRIRDGVLRKVVLARTLRVRASRDLDAGAVLAGLRGADPDAHVFGVRDAGGRAFLGASPEVLVRKRGRWIESVPLAGSAPRSGGERAARELLASAKDRHEHALVVEATAEGLAPFCDRLDVDASPWPASTATMWHLATRVRGRLRDERTGALGLAAALHPTPAVCGTPRGAAAALIDELEPFDRGLYAGIVGWTDAAGDGEWAVALRCASLDGREARLYAGAGIVAGSDPDAEVAETDAKFRTTLRALGCADG